MTQSEDTDRYEDKDRIAEYLRVTFETIDQAVTIYDKDFRLVAWNQQYNALNLMPEKYIQYGASLYEAYVDLAKQGGFGPGDPKEIAEKHISAVRDGPLIEREILHTPDGKLIRIRRFRLPLGGVCATFLDVTEQTRLQEQLRQSSKMDAVGRLTGGIAHDFNNVLAVVMANLELARDTVDPVNATRHLQTAIDATDRGAELTHRLLAFARRQPLSPRICKPCEIMRELLPMLRTLLGEHIEVELVCDAGLWLFEVDRNQFENVVVNLAINARDAMPNGGKLTIETTNTRVDTHYGDLAEISPGQYVCIAFTDTGKGMDKTTVEKAFDPFFTTKKTGAGTGLGLSMAHGFIKQSDGHLKLYSEPDEGTMVKIYLPRAKKKIPTAELSIPEPELIAPVSRKVILLVEDDEDLRKTIRALLLSSAYQVFDVKDGPSALELLERSGPIDLLLTDVVLPGGLNGADVARAAMKQRPKIKVLYMSGYSENAIIHHGRLKSGVRLLQKPFRKADLIREIEDITAS